jgi:hypothetical protein
VPAESVDEYEQGDDAHVLTTEPSTEIDTLLIPPASVAVAVRVTVSDVVGEAGLCDTLTEGAVVSGACTENEDVTDVAEFPVLS